MPLTDTEWDLVTEWVRDHLFIAGEPRPRLVQFGFPQEFVGDIPLSNVSSDNAVALVEAVRNRGVTLQLQLLDTLTRLDSLSSIPAAVVVLRLKRELDDAARSHGRPEEDHFLTGVLKNGAEVFIDRTDLRRKLREFVADPDKTVLVVDGDPDSGRSYTYTLIRHLGVHCGFRPVRVTLGRTSTAEQVVRRLAEFVADPRTGISPLNPTQLNDPLPAIDAAVHRIVSRATAADEQFWLVLDECDAVDVNSDVWDCIGKLALTIYEHTPVRRETAPRLVLLGYSATTRQLPYEIRKNEVHDTAHAAGADDLRQFFQQFFAQAPPPPDRPPPDARRIAVLVDAAVSAVLGAAEAPGPDSYMRKVCTASEEAVRLYGSLAPDADFGALLRERLCAAAAAPGPAPVPALRTAYREAASLLTRFDPERLMLPGETEPSGRADLELVGDCRTLGPRDTCGWVLKPEVRDATLRALAGPERARLALLANERQIPPGPGPERSALAYLTGTPPDLALLGADELPHVLQAVLWLAEIPGATGIPPAAEVQRLLERTRLLHPLERLVHGAFQGRTGELAELRAYIGLPPEGHGAASPVAVDGPGPSAPPVLVHGPGGVGKSTLLAKFLLDSLRDFPAGFPFAYVDFERPTLSVHEPATLIAEMARQLGIQFPRERAAFDALAATCEESAGTHRAGQGAVDELYQLSTTRATFGRLSSSGLHARAAAREAELARRLAALVVRAQGGDPAGEQGQPGQPPPLVIVIDSFEEAQYSASPILGRMWAVWSALQESHPRLRTVVAGRGPIEHPARVVRPRTIELGDLDRDAAVALLMSCGVTGERLATELADRVGGHPLSLKLAARAVVREADGTGSPGELIDSLPARRRHFFRKVDQMLIQGILYERILDRIPGDEVRALAQAGLALRTITPELIRTVLAAPCGLRVESAEQAGRLFGRLSRLDLVESAGPGAVRHRADLRAIMLRLADRARADLMRTVGQRAVVHFAAVEGPEARAEEIYHRLRLNENPREVDRRWLPGVERFLDGAAQDMAGRSAAYLSGQLGGHTSDEVMADADQEDWERITAREVEDLLAQGYAEVAADRLAGRRPWTPGSPLHPLWAETLDRLGRRTEARAATDAAVDGADEAGFPELRLELLLLSARMAEADGDLAEAGRDLGEAEELAAGLGRDFEALGALLARARLASASDDRDVEVEGRLAERLRRLPDAELVRRPALVRAAAAEVSRDHPRVLEHTLEVVGLPETEEAVLDALAEAIDGAVAGRPELRASLRDLLANAIGPPDRPSSPDHARAEYAHPASTRPEDPEAGDSRTGYPETAPTRPGPTGTGDAGAGPARPGDAEVGDPGARDPKAGHTRPGDAETGEAGARDAEARDTEARDTGAGPTRPGGTGTRDTGTRDAGAVGPRTGTARTGRTYGGTHAGMTGILREARRRGTLDRLARRLLSLDDTSGGLVSGVAAAMSAGAPAAPVAGGVALAAAHAPGGPPAPAPASGADPSGEGNGRRAA
ncbi:AAA family ATPase [Streptomyces sp. NPDC055254]